MASLEDMAVVTATFLTEHAGGPVNVPLTVPGMIDLFGGGREGRDALARELAAERLAAGKQYKNGAAGALAAAKRNIQRYTTEASEKRTPKQLAGDLSRIAEREAGRIEGNRILEEARDRGGVSVDFAGYVLISKDERYREFQVTIRPDDPALAAFVAAAQQHEWFTAANELNYAVLQAWDAGRGNITGNGGAITDVDTFDVGYGPEM